MNSSSWGDYDTESVSEERQAHIEWAVVVVDGLLSLRRQMLSIESEQSTVSTHSSTFLKVYQDIYISIKNVWQGISKKVLDHIF